MLAAPPDKGPVSAEEFAASMARFAPFEQFPKLAVAVSGGADSMCLATLAKDWVRARGGTLRCFIVDHALRDESAMEAANVAGALQSLEMDAEVLRWDHPPIHRAVQRRARDARYALLDAALARWRALHLLVAHHADDQLETVAMRTARGSGVVGLSGMPAVTERAGCRVLRPFLRWSKLRLVATLKARGMGWIDDPSNGDLRFARARLRQENASPPRTLPDADCRQLLEQQAADFLARYGRFSPDRQVELDRMAFRELPADLGRYVLGRCVSAVGERIYPPSSDVLLRLHANACNLSEGAGTLAGCVVRLGQRWIRVRPEKSQPIPWRPRLSVAPAPFGRTGW